MPSMVGVSAAIDEYHEANEKGPRPHMGASQIGKPCKRMLVYSFRHATRKKTSGRMLRLFSRGHHEEPRIIADLRAIGFEVQEVAERLTWHDGSGSYAAIPWDDWETFERHDLMDCSDRNHHVRCAEEAGIKLRQWSFSDIGGHHAGSTDGKFRNPSTNLRQFPGIPTDTWGGLEFKTYNTKGFTYLIQCAEKLAALGGSAVREVKPEHYSQMQEYMHYMGLPFCLYIAINKNDDQYYDEVVPYDQGHALECVAKAREVISARQLPNRIASSATDSRCKFCDYKSVCHFGEPLLKSCRTCKHAAAITEGDAADWHCALWQNTIPSSFVKQGCDNWSPITD